LNVHPLCPVGVVNPFYLRCLDCIQESPFPAQQVQKAHYHFDLAEGLILHVTIVDYNIPTLPSQLPIVEPTAVSRTANKVGPFKQLVSISLVVVATPSRRAGLALAH
jgi:hypothetical protein